MITKYLCVFVYNFTYMSPLYLSSTLAAIEESLFLKVRKVNEENK
jgi:hypothetical protein